MRLVGVERGLAEGMTKCLRGRCQNGASCLDRVALPRCPAQDGHHVLGHGPLLLVEGLILLEPPLGSLLLEGYPSQGVTPSWILASWWEMGTQV